MEGMYTSFSNQEFALINENSLGLPIAENVVDLAIFWEKFKGSLAVDCYGRPLVLYHGTNKVFDKFKIPDTGKTAGTGVFFTDNYEIALTYGKNIHTVYLVLKAESTPVVDFEGLCWSSGPGEYVIHDEGGYPVGDCYQTLEEALKCMEEGQTIMDYPLMINEDGELDRDMSLDIPENQNYSTDDFAYYARRYGFTGIVFRNIIDYGKFNYNRKGFFRENKISNVYCVMYPEESIIEIESCDCLDIAV